MRTASSRTGAGVLFIALVVAGCGSGSTTTPATSKSTSTSSQARSIVQPAAAVWPFADGPTRYSDPVKAARGFATTYLGFVDPVVGRFRPGDTRSGEVVIKPTSSGPETTVTVRKLTPDDTWWVLAASTPTLQLQSPTAMASISSPVTLSGESTAFEGTVSVEIRRDGALTPVTTNFVTGGANGQMGPFSKAISFDAPTVTGGAIILKTFGSENNVLWEASVVRIRFATPGTSAGKPIPDSPAIDAITRDLTKPAAADLTAKCNVFATAFLANSVTPGNEPAVMDALQRLADAVRAIDPAVADALAGHAGAAAAWCKAKGMTNG